MNPAIFSYIVKSTLGLALFFLFYITLLSKERFYGFNRFYLLFSLIFSLVVPLLTLPEFIPTKEMVDFLDLSKNAPASPQIRIEESGFVKSNPFIGAITSLYWAVTLFLAIRFFYSIFKLTSPKSIHSVKYYNGYKIVLVDNLAFPYTFLSTIYVNSKEYIEQKIPPELFAHEILHVSGLHSLETIFMELLKIFYWFNPLLYIYKKAIILNHEYLADRAVTKNSGNNQSYINILLEKSFRNNNTYLASSFNYSFIKKRIIMMTNDKISKRAILKKIAAIPLFLALGLLIINGQDPKTVSTAPPPPPPPPPSTNGMWWTPILEKNNVSLDPAKSLFSEELVETGEQFSREGDVISMKNAFILSKSVNNLYRIIRASSATHDILNSTLKVEGATVETYEQGNNGDKLINTERYTNMTFKFSNGIIAPPPPPPPPPASALPPASASAN